MTTNTQTKKKKFDWSAYLFILPYASIFLIFIVLLLLISFILSFTYYDSVNFPSFVGFTNYITLFTQDTVFMQNSLPNTVMYALIVGPGGYILSFLIAWVLAQLPKRFRNVAAIICYLPSLVGSVLIAVVWKVTFSGDSRGYLNYILLEFGILNEPYQWLQDTNVITWVVIIVGLWSSMGIGFLAMLSGILNINQELYANILN